MTTETLKGDALTIVCLWKVPENILDFIEKREFVEVVNILVPLAIAELALWHVQRLEELERKDPF